MPCVEKEYMIQELAVRFGNAPTIYVSGFSGLGVADINELRGRLDEAESQYLVIKNSIAERALKDAGLEGMGNFIKGPTAFVLTKSDPLKALKVVVDFAKKHKGLEVKGGLIEGDILTDSRIAGLASVSSKDDLIVRFVSVLNYPLAGLVGTLSAVLGKFIFTIEAIRKFKEKEEEV